ncbi:N/A [soil metagenome]
MSAAARALRWVVRAYQGLRAGRPSPCRFEPSCSTYAMEALELHGAGRGSLLALRRLSRCRPFGGHGWDPVPLSSAAAAAAADHHHERTVA